MAASGQEDGRENLRLFKEWASLLTDADFRSIERGGKLSRAEIIRATGFGRSVLRQNPSVKQELEALEARLRSRGVLPPLVHREAGDDGVDEPEPIRATGQVAAATMAARLKALESRFDILRAENKELKNRLKRFEVLESVLGRTGRLPR